jgi:hypothetical protein
MTNEEILREYNSLPVEAQRQIEGFIAFLRERFAKKLRKPARSKGAKTAHLLRACFCNFCGSPHEVRAQKRHTYFVRVSAIFANQFCLGIEWL